MVAYSVHSVVKMNLSCKDCDFTTSNKREFNRHSRVHRHRCLECDCYFTSKPKLVAHTAEVHRRSIGTQTEPQREELRRGVQRHSRPRERGHGYDWAIAKRPRWQPARRDEPTPQHSVSSVVVPVAKVRATSPARGFSDTDPLGLLDQPHEINF